MSVSRVYHHALWFIDQYDVIILINDIECYILRNDVCFFRLGDIDIYPVSGLDDIARLYFISIYGYIAGTY